MTSDGHTTRRIDSCSVAEAYLALLADRGVDCLFANAGTDFAPIIEALAKAQATGARAVRPVTVPHENVAVSMAIGYFLNTGRPQLVMVHVNVGTANAICAVMNAWRGNIPVLFTAGRTPFSEDGGVIGARTGEIHWPQEMRDQRALLREVVKWDYELSSPHVLEACVDRALNIAVSAPQGPVYLTLPRETLATRLESFTFSSPSRRAPPSASFPNLQSIEQAADMLGKAENPLIITSSLGKSANEYAALAQLAERFALPVAQRKPRYVALPSDHPMHIGYNPDAYLDKADVILVLECDTPWIPNKKKPRADCKIIHAGIDPIFAAYPMRAYPCDLAIAGSPEASLNLLCEALEARRPDPQAIERRRTRTARLREELEAKRRAAVAAARTAVPLDPAWITHCIDAIRDERTIIVKESPLAPEHLRLTQPGTYFSVGAAGGLGWGLGVALGLKCASPEQTVICTVGDGAYMFGNPVPAHYVSMAEKLPILTIVFNNQMWGAVKRNTREVYPDGFAARSNAEPLTYFNGCARFEKVVESMDGYGECVRDPAELPRALERARTIVQSEGRQALLNVICRGP